MKKLGEKKRYLLWGISIIVMLAFSILAIRSDMIPGKYLLAGILAAVVLYVILFFLQKRWGKGRFAIAAVVEVLLIAVCCYGMSVFHHAASMIQRITETVIETDSVSAYVMQDSTYESLQDAAESGFGIVEQQSREAVMQMLTRFSQECGIELDIKEYTDMFLAADALRADEIQVLVLNDAYAGLISEIEGYEWFDQETRVLESSLEEVAVEKTDSAVSTAPEETVTAGEPETTDTGSETTDAQESDSEGTAAQESDGEEAAAQETPVVMELMEAPEQVDWNALVNQEMLEVPEGTFVMYISGADTWGRASTKSRSDVNILAVVNTNTKKVLLVSTPRDYYVPLSISNGVKDKLTHAGIYGINTSMETLEMLYGVDIQYYVKVNFTGFVGIIDALGGVDVYSDSTFTVGEDFSYTQGMNYMSGIEALAFARERYSFSGGDRARGTHQMEVIKAVLNKCASSSILYNYADVMNSISGCFTTNMSQQKIASLVKMQLGDMAQWTITSMSVDGTGASKTTYSIPSQKAYVMIPDEATVQAAKDSIAAVLAGQ